MGEHAGQPQQKPKVEIDNISKDFLTSRGRVSALRDINLTVADGEFLCICGPSGSGKSTLFNIIAGLQPPTRGTIRIDGVDVTSSVLGHVSYMFQKDLLVPWRTVTENVTLGLEVRGVPSSEAEERARSYIKRYGLAGFEDTFPKDLSGGMRQRVALMRTMVLDNSVILMDEPFSALDYPTKLSIETEVRELASELDKTVLFVTHDIDEAVSMGDRVVVLSRAPGRVKAIHDVNLFQRYGSVVRARGAEEFREHFNRIWDELEVTTDVGAGAGAAAAAGRRA
ncbi:MAG TPA: ABC transporter ATP-binding protein [Egibacteraceae bacterium]|nr:ABC transporter ATP-binding protein [Egibacteraceae bacterium]